MFKDASQKLLICNMFCVKLSKLHTKHPVYMLYIYFNQRDRETTVSKCALT